MSVYATETSPLLYARVAGVLYLMIIVSGIFSEVFVRSRLIVSGDAAATVDNILASERLFRIGFAADTLMLFCDVAIAVLFYVLLKPVNKTLALTAAVFRLMQAAILGVNLLNYYAALLLLKGKGYAAAFKDEQLHALVIFYLDMHRHGYDLALLFFALSSFVLGYLVIKSGYFPRTLGYGLIAAALVYLCGSFTLFLAPGYAASLAPVYIIPLVAELSFCVWLLIKGVRVQPEKV